MATTITVHYLEMEYTRIHTRYIWDYLSRSLRNEKFICLICPCIVPEWNATIDFSYFGIIEHFYLLSLDKYPEPRTKSCNILLSIFNIRYALLTSFPFRSQREQTGFISAQQQNIFKDDSSFLLVLQPALLSSYCVHVRWQHADFLLFEMFFLHAKWSVMI